MCCFLGDRFILWYNIYDSLLFVGLKLFNCEDSEIKKILLYFMFICIVYFECFELDMILCIGVCI